MFIYEKEWCDDRSFYTAYTVDTLNHPMHFHNTFEINYCISGEIDITIDDTLYTLKAGDSLFIFPRQLHSYTSKKKSNMYVIIFSTDMIGAFSKKYTGMLPESNRLNDISAFEDKLMTENYFIQKGMLYEICGLFENSTEFKTEKYGNDLKMLHNILLFIEENYASDCSLKRAAQICGYSYTYLSKCFSHYMEMSYIEYLNRYRISRAVYLLKSSNDMTISRISSECGFDSICSFNRNFKKYTGMTPHEMSKLN